MRIKAAPVIRPLTDERSWVNWFSQLGDALTGRWGVEWRELSLTNLAQPDQQILNYRGSEVSFLFYWNDGVEITSSSQITLSKARPEGADLSLFPARLQVWEGSTLVGGAVVADRTITFPNLGLLAGQVIVQGTAIIETKNPRGVI